MTITANDIRAANCDPVVKALLEAVLTALAGTSGTFEASKYMALDSNGSGAMPDGGYLSFSNAALAAAGSGQSTYAQIADQINVVTGADGTKGVALPAASAGLAIFVANSSTTSPLPVSPVNGGNDAINSLTAGTGVFTMAPGRAAWFMPTSGTQWYVSPDVAGNPLATEDVTGTKTLVAGDSGKTIWLDSTTEFVTTLPAPADGLRFTFVVKSAPSGASYTVVTNSSANIIKGVQVTAEDAGGSGDSGTADDTITFVDGQAVAGDKVEVVSDGTYWYAYATSKLLAGITFTQAS